MKQTSADTEHLELDDQTLSDLEIFESENGGDTLFDFCNHTHTKGGEKRLRQRMKRPWSSGKKIIETQRALACIVDNRYLFNGLPSGFATSNVEVYLHGVLPFVESENFIEFALSAYSLWAIDERHYFSILKGVQLTCKCLSQLREFLQKIEFEKLEGEMAPLLVEMKSLLERDRLADVPLSITGFGLLKVWKVLRLDQTFRIQELGAVSRLLDLVYEIDALTAMADTQLKHDFRFPKIDEGPLTISAENLVHPYVRHAIANPVLLNTDNRGLFLTGPNMAGKTTYLRAFAISLYLAQMGMGVPATRFHFTPVAKLYSAITLSDDLRNGISYFRAEALRVKEVAEAIVEGHRLVAILDEPFKGTNVKDTFEASKAILERFSARDNCLFMFSSHQLELGDSLREAGYPIDCRYFEAN